MAGTRFNFGRLLAIIIKEFIQLRRDRLTFAMMIGIPIIQMTLFGFAINGDPKRLPTVVVAHEQGLFTRSLVAAFTNSGYFAVVNADASEREADRMLAQGEAQFAITIPADFSHRLIRGERPALLLEADATDPSATGNAIAAVQQLAPLALQQDLTGVLASLQSSPAPFEIRIHRRYNPEGVTQYNIVPGLMGVILTMTLIMMTALGVTREVERGTMENLLATPALPLEVMVGKITPYILIGYVQVAIILLAARYVFSVPFAGSLALLLVCVMAFIAANLTVGITISSAARNQTQAMQMTFFFFLPSMLLSGFMFPFRGMPGWAQVLGELLPLTHFLRLIRGVMLKGNGAAELWVSFWPLLLFTAVVMAVGLKRFRKTLD
ncbi:MAG: ABC transporter permease [Candidatus Competibacteraceae bacterium]|uniref:ABC-2 type transporter n=1 Tax=Candidatus Contendobacter odensis Run_B_J11 TaxID=1400861 RepID=A0A7U7G8S3_9GAMM|nr:ABC transporter permease [Candidatus Contendobacter odensis]MBK8537102.1 ABC transporter permease [Candidatus Competibacteraceae bacterium]MBK8755042.1 ABC transporter permease [Candidatus Competibacteraceae bacterium]CDH43600.1 ABC-2 type transporter [Candidatus Contendobacter odensis Run_B_J11]